MPTKAREKFIRSLHRKPVRQQEGLFIVEGRKMCEELLASTFPCLSLYLTGKEDCLPLADTARLKGVQEVEIITETVMDRLTTLASPSPALAVAQMKRKSDSTPPAPLDPAKLYLALDGVHDPGNLGTIFRLADWFGIEEIFLSEDAVEVYNPKTVQATMGAIFRIPWRYTDLCSLVRDNAKRHCPVYGTTLDGENLYLSSLTSGGLIVMGSESFGIREPLKTLLTNSLYIPSFSRDNAPCSESLNLATATGIILAEFRRLTSS